jgi:hypothetical protein
MGMRRKKKLMQRAMTCLKVAMETCFRLEGQWGEYY